MIEDVSSSSGEDGCADIGNGSTLVSFSPAPRPSTGFSSYVDIESSEAFRWGFSDNRGLAGFTIDGPELDSVLSSGTITSQLSSASSSASSSISPSLKDLSLSRALSFPFPLENIRLELDPLG